MPDIVFRLVAGAAAAPAITGYTVRGIQKSPLTYHIKNIQDLNIEARTPVTPYPIPQTEDQDQILVKVEGNSTIVNVSWIIKDEDVTAGGAGPTEGHAVNIFDEAVTASPAFGIPAYPPAEVSTKRILTAEDHVKLLLNEFAPRDINARYHFFLNGTGIYTDSTPSPSAPPNPPFQTTDAYSSTVNKRYGNATTFKRMGVINQLSVTMNSSTPVTYTASLQFITGNSIISVENII